MALALGQPDVFGMLRRMTLGQFREWLAYAELEPFGVRRDNYHAAVVAKVVADAGGLARKDGAGVQLDDFMLVWEPPAPKTQVPPISTTQSKLEQKAILETLAYALAKGK